jgi:hypothetical protein
MDMTVNEKAFWVKTLLHQTRAKGEFQLDSTMFQACLMLETDPLFTRGEPLLLRPWAFWCNIASSIFNYNRDKQSIDVLDVEKYNLMQQGFDVEISRLLPIIRSILFAMVKWKTERIWQLFERHRSTPSLSKRKNRSFSIHSSTVRLNK